MSTIKSLIDKHTSERFNSISLIVSENRMNDHIREILSGDLQSRYAADFYSGTNYTRQIISLVTEITKNVFGTDYANLSPVSGNVSFIAAVLGLSEPKSLIARIPPFFPGGGYPFKFELFDRIPLDIPFSMTDWQIDIEATVKLLKKNRPPLVILASSIVTFPVPLKEISDVVHEYGGIVAYDASHTMGLILGGHFQDPFKEGTDLLFGSTHKTFPGPQGGLVVTNNKKIHEKIQNYANFTPLDGPRLMCNPHIARIAATGIVMEETNWKRYATSVVNNARTIANTLIDEGIPLHGQHNTNYPERTYCHQVVPICSMDDGRQIRDHLAQHHVLIDGFARMGTSEITRLGYRETDCTKIGKIVAGFIKKDPSVINTCNETINGLIKEHQNIVL